MLLNSKRKKINIEPKLFYAAISSVAIFVLINTIFFAISMNPKEIVKSIKGNTTFEKFQVLLVVNYLIQMSICIVFSILIYLSLYKIKIGYLFTSISIISFTSVVFIPIILNKDITNYKSIVNIILFVFIQIAIAFIHKEIFLHRKIEQKNKRIGGGIKW